MYPREDIKKQLERAGGYPPNQCGNVAPMSITLYAMAEIMFNIMSLMNDIVAEISEIGQDIKAIKSNYENSW